MDQAGQLFFNAVLRIVELVPLLGSDKEFTILLPRNTTDISIDYIDNSLDQQDYNNIETLSSTVMPLKIT